MKPEINPTHDKTTRNQDIPSDLLRIIYSSIPISLAVIFINSAILSFIQWDVIAHSTILIWFCAINFLSLIRIGLYGKFKTLNPEKTIPGYWHSITLATNVTSGALWGAVAIWLFPENNIVHQVIPAFVLAGMCAGAVTTLSPKMSSSIAFITLALVPLIARFLLEGTSITYAMATMSILFAMTIIVTSKKMNRTIKESLLIRQQRTLAEESIHYHANYDMLTDLPNRRLLSERLKQEIKRSIRHKYFSAVLFLDIDHFKTINDSLGHAVGDDLLKQIAQRIKKRVRGEDITARLGGDEFIILISEAGEDINDATNNAVSFSNEILLLFNEPFVINNHEIHVTVSIGITVFPLTETTPDKLLQKADIALYEAKESGRNTVRLFLPEMQKIVNNRRAIEKGLHQALEKSELELYYQPQVNADNKIFGVEALLRWNHPDKGLVTPDKFIEIAEKSGLIVPIGEWVLKTACRQFSTITSNTNLSICINVSPRQFSDSLFIDKVKNIIAETGINPKSIQLEITEGMILENVDETIEKMEKLKSIGISFAIDDFGTGYSSLTYLKRLPVNILKIDKSFVLDVINNKNDAVIVETIIAMAKHMQIDIVAEGVESWEIMAFLESKGCQKFQGYLFGKPLPLTLLEQTLNESHFSQQKLSQQ